MTERAPSDPSASQARQSKSAPAGTPLGNARYVVTRLIGEGAQGQTLEAIDKRDGSLVAIKRFSVRGASSWKDVELAEREARVLAQLDHPALPRHLDHLEEGGALLLVMSLVRGEDLATARERGTLFSTRQVLELLWQMGDVLAYLQHRAPPVIHRDIKPRNIVQRPDGGFSLVDFGSVRDRLNADGSTVVGTYGFMAPEQFQGRALPVSDVYGLGATALVLLTGVAPEDQPHQGLAIDVRAALGPSADPRLVKLLAWMLTPDPDQRLTHVQHGLTTLFGAQAFMSKGTPAERSSGVGEQQTKASPPRHQTPSSARGSRKPTRKQRKAAKREAERARKQAARAVRQAKKNSRAARAWYFGGPLLVVALLVGLFAARLATFALLRVSLPLVLAVLSLVFGRALWRASERIRAVGKLGDESLRRAARRVRGVTAAEGAPQPPNPGEAQARSPRVRVDAAESVPRGKVRVVETQAEALDDDERGNAKLDDAELDNAELDDAEPESGEVDAKRRRR